MGASSREPGGAPRPPQTHGRPAPGAEATRLAPSPTGALHLGNARTFLVNWAVARAAGWRVAMRVEDLDGPRVKPDAERQALDTLAWLGLDWDGPVLRQSDDLAPYIDAMRALARRRLVFPSTLTRREIAEAASAPHNAESRFPPELRPGELPADFDPDTEAGWRFATPPGPVPFDDAVRGPCAHDPSESVGDFIVWTKRRQPAYQLAVVVDDARQGVTRVVRADDLLDSTARQLLLIDALGLGPPPAYAHLPLVVGPDGRRLAKRHGDTRVSAYRDAGAPPQRVVGLLARWSGVTDGREEMDAAEFAARFDAATMPREPAVFTGEDDEWLRAKTSGG